MNNKYYMNAQDVRDVLGVSRSKAYDILRKLNAELKKKVMQSCRVKYRGRIGTQSFMVIHTCNMIKEGEQNVSLQRWETGDMVCFFPLYRLDGTAQTENETRLQNKKGSGPKV